MGTFFVYVCSALCLLVYIPVVLNGMRGLMTRQTQFNSRLMMVVFKGTPAIIFSIGQTAGGVLSIYGIMLAVSNNNLLYIPPFVLLGAAISMAALYLARKAATGEHEMQFTQPHIRINLQNIRTYQGGINYPADTGAGRVDSADDDPNVITIEAEDVRPVDDDFRRDDDDDDFIVIDRGDVRPPDDDDGRPSGGDRA